MRQNEIILVSQNKSTLDYIENHLSYSLKKAVCHLSRSRKIHKTDEISEIKKFIIHTNVKGSITQSYRVNLWRHNGIFFFARITTSKKVQSLVQFHKISCSHTSHYCMPLRRSFSSVFTAADSLKLPFLSASQALSYKKFLKDCLDHTEMMNDRT